MLLIYFIYCNFEENIIRMQKEIEYKNDSKYKNLVVSNYLQFQR